MRNDAAMNRFRSIGATLMAASLLCFAPLALSDDEDGQYLREAVERNEIVPLRTILDWIERHYRGQVVEVEFEKEDDGEMEYEVDLLTPEGSKIEFEFDARTGDLRSASGKDVERARR
jgi:uncharacterized membrane protein YkoI